MIDERTHRAIPLGVTLLIATLAALAALAVSGGPAAQAHGEPAVAAKGSVTGSEFALRQGMRSLWEDHVSWTRLAIISLTTGSPDTKATVARLLRNQSDIGNAIKPYYGAKAGTGLTRLLREHILIAADLVAAAKAATGPSSPPSRRPGSGTRTRSPPSSTRRTPTPGSSGR